jgi:hypothetical protein
MVPARTFAAGEGRRHQGAPDLDAAAQRTSDKSRFGLAIERCAVIEPPVEDVVTLALKLIMNHARHVILEWFIAVSAASPRARPAI